MIFTTNIYLHYNVKYFDINSAGPTLIENLGLIPEKELTSINDKLTRNIKYGKILKSRKIEKYIPWLLKTFCKLICFELDGILYTQDSIVCNKNITESYLAQSSFFTFKKSWTADILVISKTLKSYFAYLSNQEIIIKGDELPPKMLKKLITIISNNPKHWLYVFKKWFIKNNNIEYFITNKNNIFTFDNKIEISDIDSLKNTDLMNKINKVYYWNILLPYFQSIYLYMF